MIFELGVASIQIVVEACVGKRSVWTERARRDDGVEVEPDRGSVASTASMEPPRRRRRVSKKDAARAPGVFVDVWSQSSPLLFLPCSFIDDRGRRAMGLKPKNGEDGLL